MYFFRQLNDEPVGVEIGSDATAEEIKIVLMSKHNFPVGNYKFVYNGQILTDPKPLEKIQPESTIFVVIKQNEKVEIPKPKQPKKSKIVSFHLDIPPNPEETFKLSAELGGPSNPTFSFRELTLEEDKTIKNAIELLKLDNVYNTSFWDYPEATSEFVRVLSSNNNLMPIVEAYAYDHFGCALTRTPMHFAPFLIAGVQCNFPIEIGETFDAALISLSTKQREDFEKVMALKLDKDKSMKTFLSNKCDLEATLKELHGN
ncbi:hypothetical protein TVAG_042620 [Trichomonas vaginalis G3]|uniref:Ubiquitin-like domain-containing protein n=1 Tax=Trichomonas vaginalis (strain ATCC PRA-98 / G3) TaxID=412133 RepID=A2G2Z4_TRIV3|nr:ubiquitin domain-containing protein 7SL RNA1-related family [Trichomonas vaginalis G3]EAX88478.1 hypothetical protein TVAG_042620 [Trichomonas vaginalis G3]KAI5486693.1 ubiquitin domain-containing protein 7SL RNA1-related family [Trichomonas vaginalis G3]|eukprot:XP_001301408.1 hypothetical protein [Trichomonas vaginalis G3]